MGRSIATLLASVALLGACGRRGEPAQPTVVATIPIDAAPDAPPDAPPDGGLPGDPTRGFELTMAKGCLSCHSPDGSERVGPTWLHLWGREVTLEDGRTLRADADYIRRSLKDPDAERVAGFVARMPSYAEFLSDAEIDDLIAYIATLK